MRAPLIAHRPSSFAVPRPACSGPLRKKGLYPGPRLAVHYYWMDGIDAFLAHAIIDPTASAAGDRAEARAAKSLGLQILGLVSERPLMRSWRARTQDGKQVGLVVIDDAATDADRAWFAAAAERRLLAGAVQGAVRVHAVSPLRDAFIVDLWTTGCATDLPTLHWPPRRRLEFVRRATEALDALHRAGVVHGCLCADNVLLDDDLQPVLAEAGLLSVHALLASKVDASKYAAFAAPEVKGGAPPDVRSDVWSAGCLLELLVGDRDLPQVAEIVRRCVATLPHARYSSAAEVAAAIEAVIAVLPVGERISRVAVPPGPTRERSGPSRLQPPGRRSSPSSAPARAVRALALAGAIAIVVAALTAIALGPHADWARLLFAAAATVGVALGTWALRGRGRGRPQGRGTPVARESRKDRGPATGPRRERRS
jgi:hypothetical protein